MVEDTATSSEVKVSAESINTEAISTKQESMQEKLQGEDFTDQTKADNSSVLGEDTSEKQTGMEE